MPSIGSRHFALWGAFEVAPTHPALWTLPSTGSYIANASSRSILQSLSYCLHIVPVTPDVSHWLTANPVFPRVHGQKCSAVLTLLQFNPCVRRCWWWTSPYYFRCRPFSVSYFFILLQLRGHCQPAVPSSLDRATSSGYIFCKTSFLHCTTASASFPALLDHTVPFLCTQNTTRHKSFYTNSAFCSRLCTVPDVDLHSLHTIGKMFYIMYLTSESMSQSGNHNIRPTNSTIL